MITMKTYHVRPEYWDLWFGGLSTEEIGDGSVTLEEIERLAREWGVSVASLMEQMDVEED